MRLGAELHELIVHLNPLVEDGPWLARVEDAAKPFLDKLRRKDIKYTFWILNSDAFNAFSTPGGYVYVSRGLFQFFGKDEDYVLEFAIGHEMAHVDLQHAIRCLQDPDVKNMPGGTLAKLYGLIIPFGYMDNQEFEADEWVLSRMQRENRDRRELLAFLRKLTEHSQNDGYINGRVKPTLGVGSSPLENHYRAHTPARKRLDHMKEIIDKALNVAK